MPLKSNLLKATDEREYGQGQSIGSTQRLRRRERGTLHTSGTKGHHPGDEFEMGDTTYKVGRNGEFIRLAPLLPVGSIPEKVDA
jgi:hypothetical protein